MTKVCLDPKWENERKSKGKRVCRLFLLVAAMCLFSFSQAAAVNDKESRVTIRLENATLADLLEQITKQTNTYILYNTRLAHEVKGLNVSVSDMRVADVLDKYLVGTGLVWVEEDNTIVIKVAEEKVQKPVATLNDKVTGIVTHRVTKEPIVGVFVTFEDSNTGAVTDKNGYYSITRPKNGGVLVFSYLGMETRRIEVKSQRVLDVTMVDAAESIDEVIVTGYAPLRKEGFSGNTTKVTKEELLRVNPHNVISAIQAFDPSFRIQQNLAAGSNPNVMPDFVLRGQTGMGVTQLEQSSTSSISRQELVGNQNSNLPIFILDGFEVDVEKVYDLDMTRIHSVNILKDAAATAMYGSRAANGVIVIELRAPEAGKLRVQYNTTLSVEMPDLSSYNLMNAAEKLETERLAGLYDSSTPEVDPYTNAYYMRRNNVLSGVDTYWLSQGLRTSVNHKHSIYVDGGENDLRWGLEFRYDNTNGVMKHSSRNKTGGGFMVDYRIGRFQIRNQVTYDYTKSSDVPFNTFSDYSHMLPYLRLYDEDGNYLRRLESFDGYSGNVVNPLYEINNYNSYIIDDYNDLTNNLSVNWEIVNHLKLRGTLSISSKTGSGDSYQDPNSAAYSSNNAANNGEKTVTSSSSTIVDGNLMLMYNNNIGKHNLNFNLAGNIRQTNASASSAMYRGFPGGELISSNYAAYITDKPEYSDNLTRLIGAVLGANYTYDNIYLFDLQGRVDGSSEFGADRRWSGFWATGLGLNIHNYGFLKNHPVISMLKIRGSYGLTGKTNFTLDAARNMYQLQTDSWYPSGYGVYLYQMGNPNLKWERKYTLDYGIELGLWKDLVHLKTSFYNEKTIDLITDYTIQSSTGFTSYKENMGSVKNVGVEIDLRLNLIRNKNWNVSVYGNFARNKNTIVEISEAMRDYNRRVEELFDDFESGQTENSQYSQTYVKYYEGASMTSIYGMKSLGISPTNGKEIYVKRNGDVTDEWSADEWSVIGDSAPKGQGSFGFTVAYKQWVLFAAFLYNFGGDSYNYTLVNNVENANIADDNVDRRVMMDRWQKAGDITTLKDIKDRNKTTGATSRFIQKDNTLQFTSLSLSYDLNQKWLKKAGIGMCRITANIGDLFYISSIRRERGLDYPFSRTFDLSLNISF